MENEVSIIRAKTSLEDRRMRKNDKCMSGRGG